jgi:hypothetical protein
MLLNVSHIIAKIKAAKASKYGFIVVQAILVFILIAAHFLMPWVLTVSILLITLIFGLIGGVVAFFIAPLTVPPIQYFLTSPMGIFFNIISFGLVGAILVMFIVYNVSLYVVQFVPYGNEATAILRSLIELIIG